MSSIKAPFLTLLLCLPLAACNPGTPPADSAKPASEPAAGGEAAATPDTSIGRKVKEATDKARRELASSNISISGNGGKAEITPQGDLLIGGKALTITTAQRELLQKYRGQVIEVAEAGIDIGVQGANLGVKAAGEALKGVFSGNTGDIEARINQEARKLEGSASRICDLLPGMRDTQQSLAAIMPAFEPFARMEQKEIDDCRNKGTWSSN